MEKVNQKYWIMVVSLLVMKDLPKVKQQKNILPEKMGGEFHGDFHLPWDPNLSTNHLKQINPRCCRACFLDVA